MILKNYSKYNYPLLSNTLSKEDISSDKKVLNSRQIAIPNITYDFEKIWKIFRGQNCFNSQFRLFTKLISNFFFEKSTKKKKLLIGDEVLISVVCWSKSLWPIIQKKITNYLSKYTAF